MQGKVRDQLQETLGKDNPLAAWTPACPFAEGHCDPKPSSLPPTVRLTWLHYFLSGFYSTSVLIDLEYRTNTLNAPAHLCPYFSLNCMRKIKANHVIHKLVWYRLLGLGVLLVNITNCTEHRHHLRPLYDHDGSGERQIHPVIMFKIWTSSKPQNTNHTPLPAYIRLFLYKSEL